MLVHVGPCRWLVGAHALLVVCWAGPWTRVASVHGLGRAAALDRAQSQSPHGCGLRQPCFRPQSLCAQPGGVCERLLCVRRHRLSKCEMAEGFFVAWCGACQAVGAWCVVLCVWGVCAGPGV